MRRSMDAEVASPSCEVAVCERGCVNGFEGERSCARGFKWLGLSKSEFVCEGLCKSVSLRGFMKRLGDHKMYDRVCQSINQSINHSISQSVNQSVSQSTTTIPEVPAALGD